MFLQPVVPAAAPGASKTQPSRWASQANTVCTSRKGVMYDASKRAEPVKWPSERWKEHSAAVKLQQSLLPSDPSHRGQCVSFCP